MRLRLAGHPLHPALVHFPIALWAAAVAADVAGWMLGQPIWWTLSFAAQAAGWVLAVPAMLAGFLDFAAMSSEGRARDVAVSHMLAMTTAWLLFGASTALRGWPVDGPPPIWASLLALAGFVITVLGGWLGGRLVYSFGVGVEAAAATQPVAATDLSEPSPAAARAPNSHAHAPVPTDDRAGT